VQASPDPGVVELALLTDRLLIEGMWALPTDSLLIGAEDGDVEELSREIEGLLQP
jgi:hypothetical protein